MQLSQRKIYEANDLSAYVGIMPKIEDPEDDLRALFDFDSETCINVLSTLFKMKRNRLDLIIPQKTEDGLVRVYFSTEIVCEAKKVKRTTVSLSSIVWNLFLEQL